MSNRDSINTICTDFDGTIADTNSLKSYWILRKLGIHVPSWKCDRSNCVPIIGEEVYNEMSNYVCGEEGTFMTKQMAGAKEVLLRISSIAPIIVITSRNEVSAGYASAWLRNLGFDRVIQRTVSCKGNRKADVCVKLNGSLLIDDDTRHLQTVPGSQLGLILFKPTDEIVTLPRNVTHVRSWQEVMDEIIFWDSPTSQSSSRGKPRR